MWGGRKRGLRNRVLDGGYFFLIRLVHKPEAVPSLFAQKRRFGVFFLKRHGDFVSGSFYYVK